MGKNGNSISNNIDKSEYIALFENLPDIIYYLDKEGKIVYINQAVTKLLGYDVEELVGKPYSLLFNKSDFKKAKEVFKNKKTGKEKKASNVELKLKCKNGKLKLFELNSIGIYNSEGDLVKIEGVLRDTTERKKAEKALKKRNKELLRLYKTSTLLQKTIDIETMLDVALKTFQDLGFDRVRIYFYNSKENVIVGQKAIGTKREIISKIKIEVTKEHKKVYRCIKEKRPIIDRECKLSEYKELLDKAELGESASLPLISGGKVIGTISVDNKHSKKPIKEDYIDYLMTFANQIAVAIDNTILNYNNVKRLKKLSTLYDVAKIGSSTLDIDEVLNTIIDKIVEMMKIDFCSILLVDESGDNLIPEAYNETELYPEVDSFSIKDSISGQVFNSLIPEYIPNVLKVKKYKSIQWASKYGYKSLLSIPLKIENKGIGVINLYTKKKRKYTEKDLNMLMALANHAAMMIQNRKLYSTIKEDKENLTALLDISRMINATLNIENALKTILENAVEFTNADVGAFMLLKNNKLEIKHTAGKFKKKLKKFPIELGKGISGEVAKKDKLFIIPNVKDDKRYIERFPNAKSEAALPIRMKGKVMGVLNLESRKPNNFKRYEDSLRILTNQIAIAIENAKLYDEVKDFNEKLKNEIFIATKELREKNIELKKLDRVKSEFVSNVSHELRTPLTSILGYAKLLYNNKVGELAEEQRQSLKIIIDESERLTRLINDVLDLAKLETGKIKYKVEDIDVVEIADHCLQTVMMIAMEKQIKLLLKKGDNVPIIKANRDLLRQVFLNLLNNAIKFTDKNGKVSISVGGIKDSVKISVKDNGCGIPDEEMARLFDKFYQVDSSMTRKHGGTGLGLPIVKHIINLHKGTIKVNSERNKGTEFIFTLPITRKKKT